jgi:hypothetical protein
MNNRKLCKLLEYTTGGQAASAPSISITGAYDAVGFRDA